MYTVKQAVIMAAGMGQRMRPVSEKIPKPLIRVNGIRMIDTVISALHKNGIRKIYVVAGYLKEQFYDLEDEYDGVKILENPYYDTCNNISSLYVARNYLEDTIILDGDQIIYNSDILQPEFQRSGYNCIWTDSHTDEWVLELKEGIVTSCSRTGADSGWQLFSVSRWNKEDGRRLKGHLEYEFEIKKNRQIYWDDVALFCHPEDYRLGIREMQPGDIVEIDSLLELAEIDNSYRKYL